MKCILCGAVDEGIEIETGFTDPAKQEAAIAKARAQADRLSQWEHLRVTITRAGGQLELVAGDVCPAEKLVAGSIAVTKA